jgi:tetratricopeptide (TPR) repeat protein
MEIRNLKFIGRNQEIDMLDHEMASIGTSSLITISGEGGIGKSRLLLEFYQNKKYLPNVIMLQPIDLSDTIFHFKFSIRYRIAEMLGFDNFRDFIELLNEYQKDMNIGVNYLVLSRLEKEIHKAFVENFNTSRLKKYVILLDTFDDSSLENKVVINFIKKDILKLQNVLVILAGRASSIITNSLESNKVFKHKHIELNPLNDNDALLLLEHPNQNEAEKLLLLTEKKPLLIGLTKIYFEFRGANRNTPSVLKKEKAALLESKELLKVYQNEFEEELFSIFIEHKFPHSKYILQMAFFEKRFTIEILAFINNISIESAENIINELSEYFFVKNHPDEIHLLHDIFRDRLKTLAWEKIDKREPIKRKKLSEKIISYYDNKISHILNEIREIESNENLSSIDVNYVNAKEKRLVELKSLVSSYTYEKFFYAKNIDINTACLSAANELKNSLKRDDLRLSSLLVELFLPEVEKLDKNESYYALNYQLARYYRTISKYSESESILLEIIQTDTTDFNLIEYYQTLSFVYKDQGLIENAANALQNSNNLCQKEQYLNSNIVTEAKIWNFNNFGQLYTDIGDYNKAVKAFNDGILLSEEHSIYNVIGSLKVNLGRTLLLSGQIGDAEITLEDSLAINESLEDNFLINYTKLLLATVETKKGAFESAYGYNKQVEEYFKANRSYKWLALSRTFLSRIWFEDFMTKKHGRFQSENVEEGKKWLLDTLKIGIESDELCEKFYPTYYGESLMHTGNIQLELAKLNSMSRNTDLANKYFIESFSTLEKALDFSVKKQDIRNIVNIKELFAEYFFEKQKSKELHQILDDINALGIEGTSHHAFKGEVYYLIGQDYLRNNDINNALINFNLSIPYLAEPGEWPEVRFQDYLEVIGKIMVSLPKDEFNYWITTFKNNWKDKVENPIPVRQQKIIHNFLNRIIMSKKLN